MFRHPALFFDSRLVPYQLENFDDVNLRGLIGKFGFDPVDVKRYDHDLVIYEFVDRGIFCLPNDSILHAELHNPTKFSGPLRSEGY